MAIFNKTNEFLPKWVDGKLIFFTQNDTSDPGEIYLGIPGGSGDMDVSWFGNTAGASILFDGSGDTITLTGVTLTTDSAMTGITPTTDYHLSTKKYVDDEITTATGSMTTAHEAYTDAAVLSLIDAAPGALDTLNELAAALNDDANIVTTIASGYNAADTVLSGEIYNGYVAADTVVTNAYIAADIVVTNAFALGDIVTTSGYEAADAALEATISGAYVAADVVVSNYVDSQILTVASGITGTIDFSTFTGTLTFVGGIVTSSG